MLFLICEKVPVKQEEEWGVKNEYWGYNTVINWYTTSFGSIY